jgi:hypothetical protein
MYTNEQVSTTCENCVFAVFDAAEKLQIGCLAGILDKIQRQDVELMLQEKDNRKTIIIPGRVCLYCRNEAWKERNSNGVPLLEVARDEITLRMEVIIYFGPDDKFVELGKTVDSLCNGYIKPTKITFCDHKNVRPSTFKNWVENRCRTSWRIEHIREDAGIDRVIHICAKKVRSLFFSIFKSGYEVPKHFISSIDSALNDDLERFILLKPVDDLNCLTLQTMVHKQLAHGQLNVEFIEKVAEEFKCKHMIKRATDIVPNIYQ